MRKQSNSLLLIGLVFLALFCIICFGVVTNSAWVKTFDLYWIDAIQSHISSGTTSFILVATELGNMRLVIALTIVIAIVLFIKKRFADGLWFGGTILFCGAIATKLLKSAINRDRPEFHQLVSKTSESFPSGHATGTTVFYGMIALALFLAARTVLKRVVIGLVAFCFIWFILATRIYLGVHFPTDVLAGFCFGSASVFISISVYLYARKPLHNLLIKFNLKDESLKTEPSRHVS
ncbi:phosphatase PAP2 family protein [Aciduricibacillus chroicocephali]|uniref:Phosphatase PAP2 family protein n=1 Tax=Aciduricibacillus chroicocephali TaxID=3054939 RepID=A0ABY9KWE7_9BACI|nr:phosphatase PAP2 family protein [Bacillaceae bacterium 44XB]